MEPGELPASRSTHSTPRLYGRDDERARIARALDLAADGHGAALVLQGVAGIGKTALLDDAIVAALDRGFEVRAATGVEIETVLPYGALSSLLAPERRKGRLKRRRGALSTVFAPTGDAEPPTVTAVAGDLLQLLSARGVDRPVCVVLDDAQWVDPSSAAVIGHVARHAIADAVCVLIARRVQPGDSEVHQPFCGVPVLEVHPLDEAATIDALVGAGCALLDARRWSARTGGLPLAIAEIARRGDTDGVSDPRDVARHLPETFQGRIASLPVAVRDFVLAAAVCGQLSVLRSLELEAFEANLAAAVEADVLVGPSGSGDGASVSFRHPLLRAAALAGADPVRERAFHRATALALRNSGSADRAALHFDAAADGPDPEAADALAELARRARQRGALGEAGAADLRAAAHTTDVNRRAALLTSAADSMFDAGDASGASAAIETALEIATDPIVQADAGSLRARMATWTRSPAEMVRALVCVADQIRDQDPGRAAAALASAATVGYLEGDLAAAIQRAGEADRLASANGDVMTAVAAGGALAWTTFLIGDIGEFDRRMAPLEPLMWDLLRQRSWAGVHLAELFSTTMISAERWDAVDPIARELVHTTRAMGAHLSAASATLLLGSLCWRRGRWDEAYALELPLLDLEDVPPVTMCWIRALVAQLTAPMGHVEQTRALIAEALPVASAAASPVIVSVANAALGHLELSLGNVDEALALLDRVAEATARMGMCEPGLIPWPVDHLDALVRAERFDEAERRCRDLEAFGRRTERAWVLGVAARVRAQLGSGRERSAAFVASLDCFERVGAPFEVARTLLARDEGTDRADARRLFLRLGAAVWADVALPPDGAKEDLCESGDPQEAPSEARGLLDELTVSERDVAMAAAAGRTNREIAAALHLSVKTVDHHLQRSFRRFGLRNRTELAMHVARALDAPSR